MPPAPSYQHDEPYASRGPHPDRRVLRCDQPRSLRPCRRLSGYIARRCYHPAFVPRLAAEDLGIFRAPEHGPRDTAPGGNPRLCFCVGVGDPILRGAAQPGVFPQFVTSSTERIRAPVFTPKAAGFKLLTARGHFMASSSDYEPPSATNMSRIPNLQNEYFITYAIHRRSGSGAWNCRFTLSSGHAAPLSLTVVFAGLPLIATARPSLASAARRCTGPRPGLRAVAGARPCGHHRPSSSSRRRARSPPSVPDHAGRDPAAMTARAVWRHEGGTLMGRSAEPCRSARPHRYRDACR